jgi:photosystem II stability/assembly factor-like uncharacterized protein
MQKSTLLILSALLIAGVSLFFSLKKQTPKEQDAEGKEIPNDCLFLQRAFPYQTLPSEAYYEAVQWAKSQVVQRDGPVWELAGPSNLGGRITGIAMHASDQQTIYAASASGGLWKSPDAGVSWLPITDGLPSLSIGDIAIDPSDKNVLYCGTGEPNGGGGSVTYDGHGLFKSVDAGQSWTAAGLEKTGSIGRIVVDPHNPNRIFVAAQGHLFGNNPERGVYRSDDGGISWQQKLFVSDSTGAIDLVINPQHPDTVYATMWQRVRRPSIRQYGGPESGIFRSIDGGDTWTKLSGGLPTSSIGRIGLAISASNPNILFATVAAEDGSFNGVYKTANDGATWVKVSDNSNPNYSSFGWWFGQIRINPVSPNIVYNLGVGWVKSSNGGNSWSPGGSSNLHADFHALFIHPANTSLMVVGNDGGLYVSNDGGNLFTHRPFPITQFYTTEIDEQHPEQLYGGAQDNGTWRTTTGQLDDWEQIWYGDGFVTLVNPVNGDYYAEYQYGSFSGSNGAVAPDFVRSNWNTPYVMDPANPNIMYFGAESLFKSVDGALSWEPISGDLSNGPVGIGGVVYGTITSISVSPLDGNIIYVGTDDGNVWVTSNGGQDWTKISATLPKRWITRVVADLNDASTAYVCLSGFRHFENIAHIYKTTDKGQSWTSMSGNLPDVPVNDLIPDPANALSFFIATDAGIFATYDGGQTWEVFGSGLPNVPVLDLRFHAPTRTMSAATYGRAMYKIQVPVPTGVQETALVSGMNVAPNPVQSSFRLSFENLGGAALDAVVYDAGGRLVQTIFTGFRQQGRQSVTVQAGTWKAGVYVVQLRGKGKVFSRKLVKV